MKTYVIMFAKQFMTSHPRVGEATDFAEKIIKGDKIHTLRGNYEYWKKIVDEVNSGIAVLSGRVWTDKPYKSKQYEFIEFTELGIQKSLVLPEPKCVLVDCF